MEIEPTYSAWKARVQTPTSPLKLFQSVDGAPQRSYIAGKLSEKQLLERAAEIEPARPAWKAGALPLHHTRGCSWRTAGHPNWSVEDPPEPKCSTHRPAVFSSALLPACPALLVLNSSPELLRSVQQRRIGSLTAPIRLATTWVRASGSAPRRQPYASWLNRHSPQVLTAVHLEADRHRHGGPVRSPL